MTLKEQMDQEYLRGKEEGIDSTIKNMIASGNFTDEQICVATGKSMDYIISYRDKTK